MIAVMFGVVMLSVVMLNVVAPNLTEYKIYMMLKLHCTKSTFKFALKLIRFFALIHSHILPTELRSTTNALAYRRGGLMA
jgi:hypothetical protein